MKLFVRLSVGLQPPGAEATPTLRIWHSMRHWLLALLALPALLLGSATGLRTAHAAPAVTTQSTCASNGTLTYHGGPVQHHPKVYFVFWGPNWSNASPEVVEILHLFYSLAGGQYNNILTQYCDNSGHIANDPIAMTGQVVYDATPPPSEVVKSQMLYEARNTVNSQGWVKGLDTQVIVFPQEGTTYNTADFASDACGWHNYAPPDFAPYDFPLVYGWVRYGKCGDSSSALTSADAMAGVASHEYAEMVTDPKVNVAPAWVSSDGQEIADLCHGSLHTYSPQNGTGWVVHVNNLWSNWSENYGLYSCVLQEGQEYRSPDDSSPYHSHHTVQGSILAKYQSSCGVDGAAGGCTSVVGPPVTEEAPISNGAVSYFGSGCSGTPSGSCAAIYYGPGGPSTATFAIWGRDYLKYIGAGGPTGTLKFPVSDPAYLSDGAVSYFAGPCAGSGPYGSCGAIYESSGTGAHAIWGNDYYKYLNLGANTSILGYPTSDPIYANGGAVSYFDGPCSGSGPYSSCGAIYDHASTGTYAIWGRDYLEYVNQGEASSTLGWPLSDPMYSSGGAVSYFVGPCNGSGYYGSCAAIYDRDDTGAHAIWGDDYLKYVSLGAETSQLSFPTTAPLSIAGGAVSYFVSGSSGTSCTKGPYNSCSAIYWSSGTGAHYVWGAIYYRYWHDFSGPNGFLGFPVSDEVAIAGGSASYFYKSPACSGGGLYGSSSAMYWSSNTHTHEVHGCIYHTYANAGGPNSKLGFPTSDEYAITNGRRSNFEHGYIWYDNSTGLTHIVYDCDVAGTCV